MKKLILFIFMSILFAHSCNNKLFSLSTQNGNGINLQNIITDLSDTCDLNIIIKDDIAKEKLNQEVKYIKLKNLTLEEFLHFLLDKNGFFYKLSNNTLEISFIKTKNFKIDYINSTIEGDSSFSSTKGNNDDKNSKQESSNNLTTKFNFDFWADFTNNIQQILTAQSDSFYKTPTPIIDKTTGIITITGTKSQLDRVQSYIDEINKRLHKEVVIDVKIYSVKLAKSNQTGINWSELNVQFGGASTLSTPLSTANILGSTSIFKQGTFNMNGFLNFLANYGQINSISNPKITTLNNQKAIIAVGKNINYSYKIVTTDANGNSFQSEQLGSKFVGILLDIIPEISDDNIILMGINPSISSLIDNQLNYNLAPNTYEKSLNTIIRVKDGDTIILGGLITDEKTFSQNGVPILKEIPVIKYLFSYKSEISNREELIFVITPHIINLDKKITSKEAILLPKLEDF